MRWEGQEAALRLSVPKPDAQQLAEGRLAEQFDAWVWLEQTSAVTPLRHEKLHGAPETSSLGL